MKSKFYFFFSFFLSFLAEQIEAEEGKKTHPFSFQTQTHKIFFHTSAFSQ